MVEEKYEFDVGADGLDYDILDLSFNRTTQSFIESVGIKPGMNILDIGCGSGVMTSWLAKKVGNSGSITSIDNSEEQLNHAHRRIKSEGINNVDFRLLSAYDVETLGKKFDLLYCRFVLHHLHSPRKAINCFFNVLEKGGVYFAEEGIVSSAFSYPHCPAWQNNRPSPNIVETERDGDGRDGDFGMKLFYNMKIIGFEVAKVSLVQPILTTRKEKEYLVKNRDVFKKTALEQGLTEKEWDDETRSLQELVADDLSIAGFYQSCQVAGIKK